MKGTSMAQRSGAFKNFLRAIVAAWLTGFVFVAGAAAQNDGGYEKIYDEPTDANLGGRPVVADIALYVDTDAMAGGDLRLALVTDVTKFIAETERDLERWIADHQEECGERWSAGEPVIIFPPDAIRFTLDLALEVYNCGWNGQAAPTRIMRETGKVDVTLQPYIENGRLQARLLNFELDDRSGVTKYVPLEFFTKRILQNELNKLNENRKFYRAPQPLHAEGFEYESIKAKRYKGGRVVITARYKATGSREKLDRLIEKMRDEGITQQY